MPLAPDEIKQAVKEHFLDGYALLAKYGGMPLMEVTPFPFFTRIIPGAHNPEVNGIFQHEFLEEGFDQIIAEQLAYLKKRQLPFCWWVNEDAAPVGSSLKLQQHGFLPQGTMHGIAVEVSQMAALKSRGDASRVMVKQVSKPDEISDWVKIFSTSFDCVNDEGLLYKNGIERALREASPSVHYYLGYLDGKPVGTGALFFTTSSFGHKVAGLWAGSVLPEARRHGVASAMASQRAQDAMATNSDVLVSYLMPDGMARGYCTGLGMKSVWLIYPHYAPIGLS